MIGKILIKEFKVNPRVNYFVKYNDVLYKVVELKKDKVKLQGFNKLVSRDEVTPIKIKVKIDNLICDLQFDDYTKMEQVTEGQEIEGYVIKVKQKPNQGDTVTITSLKIIDKMRLYETKDRYATVHTISPTQHTLILNKNSLEINCKRADYTLVNVYDEQRLFVIPCKHCNK